MEPRRPRRRSAPRRALRAGSWIGLAAVLIAAPGGERAAVTDEASCGALSPAAARGKRLFQRGVSADGRALEGALAGGAAALSGHEAACARCHGAGGEGSAEGGVTAPPLTRERLAAPTRARAAYTPRDLAAAIREGRAPDARPLHPVMPRYQLGDRDLADLIGYLACVGRDPDPGVTPDAVEVGAALPLSGPDAPAGAAARAALVAAFDAINERGGIYRRRLALAVEDSAGPGGAAGAAARLLDRGVLALVGSAFEGDPGVTARLAEERAPLVGPLGAFEARSIPGGGMVFQIQPGPDVLARAAVQHLASAGPEATAGALIVRAEGRAGEAWDAGARAESARRSLPAPVSLSFEPGGLDPRDVAGAAARRGARAILFWGAGADLARLAASGAVPAGVTLVAPLASVAAAPEDRRRIGDRALFLVAGPVSGGATARASAMILIEALKRAGAHPTRERLLAALEGLRGFDTGDSFPLSFARNRRVGIHGAVLVRLDPATGAAARASEWIEVAPY